MFTGLVTHTTRALELTDTAPGELRLVLENPFPEDDPVCDGESIAVNGCCLTALPAVQAGNKRDRLEFFVSPETRRCSALGRVKAGSRVNLERSLKLGARLGGHQVSGHIDTVGRVILRQSEADALRFEISYPAKFARLLVEKGSIAVDGVSLTVNELFGGAEGAGEATFRVTIIPHTAEFTTLGGLSDGDEVNLEFDLAAKHGLRALEHADDGDLLRSEGLHDSTTREAAMTGERQLSAFDPGVQADGAEFDTIEDAVADIRAGKMVIVLDSEHRENEGDLIMAAEKVTPESINFMVTYGRGLVCVPMEAQRLAQLELPQMSETNTAKLGTRFSVTVDLLAGTTTGVSAADRALTVAALASERIVAAEFGRPGHVFPLESAAGGVLSRPGHTEAAVDLSRLAGLAPVGALCEIMSDDGRMARTPELLRKARNWGLRIIAITSLIEFLRAHPDAAVESAPPPVESAERIADVAFPTRFGEFRLHLFKSHLDGKDHLALVKGAITGGDSVLTRIHSECLTGDTLGSLRCDCGAQLEVALKRIEAERRGVVLYMRQEGRGIGLSNKIKAYALQDRGDDTVEANLRLGFEADLRDYSACASMLRLLGVGSVALMTNNPHKVQGLVANGISVISRSSVETPVHTHNHAYMRAKRDKLGHLFTSIDVDSLRRRS